MADKHTNNNSWVSIFNSLILYVPLTESVKFLKIIKHVTSRAKNWVRLQVEGFGVGPHLPSTQNTLACSQPQNSTRLWLELSPSIEV